MAVRATKVLRVFTVIGKVKRIIHYVIILKNEEETKRGLPQHIWSGLLGCTFTPLAVPSTVLTNPTLNLHPILRMFYGTVLGAHLTDNLKKYKFEGEYYRYIDCYDGHRCFYIGSRDITSCYDPDARRGESQYRNRYASNIKAVNIEQLIFLAVNLFMQPVTRGNGNLLKNYWPIGRNGRLG